LNLNCSFFLFFLVNSIYPSICVLAKIRLFYFFALARVSAKNKCA
jgi:hypothetical protein